MEDTNVSTKEKSATVTSPTKASLQSSPALPSTNDGQKSVTSASAEFQKETEKILDALGMIKDATNCWPCKMNDGKMPIPLISSEYGILVVSFPLGGHVIKTVVTSDGKLDYEVDGHRIIPVTSEEK